MVKRHMLPDDVKEEIRRLKVEGKKYKEIGKIIEESRGLKLGYPTIAYIANAGKKKESKAPPRKKESAAPKAGQLVDEIMEYVQQMHGAYLGSLLMIRGELIKSRGEIRELKEAVKKYKKGVV